MTEQHAHLDNQPLNELEEQLARGEQADANPVEVDPGLPQQRGLCAQLRRPRRPRLPGGAAGPRELVGQARPGRFLDPSRVTGQYLEAAPNVLGTQGAAILGNLGDELGMVINPGAAFGFEIDPEAVADIRRDFKPTDEPVDGTPDGDRA